MKQVKYKVIEGFHIIGGKIYGKNQLAGSEFIKTENDDAKGMHVTDPKRFQLVLDRSKQNVNTKGKN